MTVTDCRRTLITLLKEAQKATGLEIDCFWECGEIFRCVAGMNAKECLMQPQKELKPKLTQRMIDVALARKSGEPLSYLLGETVFCGVKLLTPPGACLIPRADTELLVEQIEKHLPLGGCFCDLCTGSGCIPAAVLSLRPDATAYALELWDPALKVAAQNLEQLRISGRVHVAKGDVLRGEMPPDAPALFDLIVSNPPYIPSKDLEHLDCQVLKEPVMALDGGEDGMRFYRAILVHYQNRLADGGCMLFEIGYDLGGKMRELTQSLGFSCEITKDYAGCDRVALCHPV